MNLFAFSFLTGDIGQAILLACLALVGYAYLGYPLLLWGVSKTFGRPPRGHDEVAHHLPTLSLLIVAHNEETCIAERIENALALKYPAERLEIVIASDGSSDRTAEIAAGYAGRGVRLLDYKQRRGKAAVLTDAIRECSGEIVALSDANTFYERHALKKLARWFADAQVGVVCGRLLLVDRASGQNVDGIYWRYETFLKKCEARLGALLGANGAIYSIRRDLYVPIPETTIVDDFVIPLLAKLKSRCRIVYDSDAIAYEETPPTIRDEFRRRSRIGAGGFQSIAMLYPIMHPRHGWTSFSFLSHKVCRWTCPFFLLGALISNAILLASERYSAVLVAQCSFYSLAGMGAFLPGSHVSVRLIRLTTMFTSMNLALLVGFWRWASGRQRGTWQRTARTGGDVSMELVGNAN
jgi:cellulose synthase/poly-beta-1,6-N-acetylglucosamine synthase-like glycosyltransferase